MKMLLWILIGIGMVSLVLADDMLIEEFEDFDNWQSSPHWEIQNESAYTDRNTVLVSNNISLENIENCTLSLDWKQGENDTRIGLRNVSSENHRWFSLENSSDWNQFEFFFDNEDFFEDDFNIKIQTQFQTGNLYVDNINLSCHVSQIESEPSSSPSIRGGGSFSSYSLPSVNFQTATGGDIAYTFSTLPLNRKTEFASLIPMGFFIQYCDTNKYNFCDFAVEESSEFVGKVDNLIIYGLIILGIFFYLKRKK